MIRRAAISRTTWYGHGWALHSFRWGVHFYHWPGMTTTGAIRAVPGSSPNA